MYSQALRPGLKLGNYPERDYQRKGALDTAAHGLSGLLRRYSRNHLKQARQFCAQVNMASERLRNQGAQTLSARARELRRTLAREGLSEPLAVECFALVREAAGETLGKWHYDSQIIGGWVLLNGMLAEMETGEGKTLMSTLPACTAALAGIPVHVITANDYLVERDAALMSPVFKLLGLSVGTILDREKDTGQRQAAYACDITYCTSKQVTFDYLRDRVAMGHRRGRMDLQLRRLSGRQQDNQQLLLRGLCYAIVDEADSILIDDAGTPLILSREVESSLQPETCQQALQLAAQLDPMQHFQLNERYRDIRLTSAGKAQLELLVAPLEHPWDVEAQREFLINQALRAQHCYRRDHDYVVRDGKVQIIDANTGRALPDHSWEQGLHQIIESKEDCELTGTRETIARMSYQRFFRRYLHLSGMTGTASEVADELWSVYGLEVVRIPTHAPVQRQAGADRVFVTAAEKWQAVVERVKELYESGRPVLLGTGSVADSEHVSQLLEENGLPHQTLNARQDKREAEVIARAGKPGAITVATNMAGRGTDISLAPGVVERGGLHVLAAVRNEARRVDRQLFGRCARQGDPGSYESMLSLEDDLLKKYLPRTLTVVMQRSARWRMPLSWNPVIRLTQLMVERHHARQRRNLVQLDQQLKETLAFTGPLE
ncbi:MAG: preprotein translocase subunit SecA [Gammaproteobacteria bacterium]